MNIAPMLFDMLMPMAMLVLAALFAIAGFKLFLPNIRGWLGERKVRGILESLNAQAYAQFHDVLLPIDGETTQIDHVLIVGDTCFVIETKAYDGWIFGSANAANWTQSFNKRSKFQFQNPIRQNYKHILAIKPFIEGLKVVGVIVFTRGTFKSSRIEGVLYSRELKDFVLKHEVNKSFDNTKAIQALQNAMITDEAEHLAHVRRLQDKHGGRWRTTVAKGFLFVAVVLVTLRLGMSPAPTQFVKAHPTPPIQKQQQQIRIQQETKAPVSTEASTPLMNLVPPVVKGLGKGKAVISDGRNYKTLNVGEQTREGWKLEGADSMRAVFSHASGQTVTVSVR